MFSDRIKGTALAEHKQHVNDPMDRNGITAQIFDELVQLARRIPVEPGEENVRGFSQSIIRHRKDRRVST